MPLQNIEDLLAHVDSKYRLVIVAAKRAKQLMRGADPLISARSFKPIYTALEEVTSGRLHFETEGAQAELARELEEAAAKPTWFRSMVADEAELVEEEVAPEEAPVAEVEEAPEPEAPPEELTAEPAELLPDEDLEEEEIEELGEEETTEEPKEEE